MKMKLITEECKIEEGKGKRKIGKGRERKGR